MRPILSRLLPLAALLVFSIGSASAAPAPSPVKAFALDIDPNTSTHRSRLVEGPDGAFYGTVIDGGTSNDGYILRATVAGQAQDLFAFDGGDSDKFANPTGPLAVGGDGRLYGAAQGGLGNGIIFAVDTSGNFTEVFGLIDPITDGSAPVGGLALGPDGQTFYGMTGSGGTNGTGVIFSVDPPDEGTYQKLYDFSALVNGSNSDGANPTSGLTLGSDGNLYGVTTGGGLGGLGTIFQVTTTGTLTTLYLFTGGTDGANPVGQLVEDSKHNLYGVTTNGGAHGFGTIFKITMTGAYSQLYSFTNGADGANPLDIVLGPGNSLWVTTSAGTNQEGSIFALYPNKKTKEFDFGAAATSDTIGFNLDSGLALGSDGNLYGVTRDGGADHNGTFFEYVLNSKTILPFAKAAGRYLGEVAESAVSQSLVGLANFNISPTGKISANVKTTKTTSYSGQLLPDGSFHEALPNGSSIQLQLSLFNGAYGISGTTNSLAVTAFHYASDAGQPIIAARYTGGFGNATALDGVAPEGAGSVIATVSKSGAVSVTGITPTGTPYHASTFLIQDPQSQNGISENGFLFFSNIFTYGVGIIDPNNQPDLQGVFIFGAPPNKYPDYLEPFTATSSLAGNIYTLPAKNTPVISSSSVQITGGGLVSPIQETFAISNKNAVTFTSANASNVAIHLNAANGTFSGTFMGNYLSVPTPVKTSFAGALITGTTDFPRGVAGFLGPITEGTNASGSVLLSP